MAYAATRYRAKAQIVGKSSSLLFRLRMLKALTCGFEPEPLNPEPCSAVLLGPLGVSNCAFEASREPSELNSRIR